MCAALALNDTVYVTLSPPPAKSGHVI